MAAMRATFWPETAVSQAHCAVRARGASGLAHLWDGWSITLPCPNCKTITGGIDA